LGHSKHLYGKPDNHYQEKGVFIADSDILDILDFNITESQSIGELLATPNTMLISRKMAEKYFPDESAVGKIIRYNNQYDMNVTGVFDNFPDQSNVNPQFFISSTTAVDEYGDKSWGAQYYDTQTKKFYSTSTTSTNFTCNASHIFNNVPMVKLVLPTSIRLMFDFSRLHAAARYCWLMFFSVRIDNRD